LHIQRWGDDLFFELGCQNLRRLQHLLIDGIELLLRAIDVALTKRL
jgi:hypothetical protein